jgi:iron(III) transport system permease protein
LLAACVAAVLWLVGVPLLAFIYTAFAEETPAGPGAFSLANVVRVYGDPFVIGVVVNTVVFAAGTAIVTFALGAGIAWLVERTDVPGRNVFHALALIAFAFPGLLTTMAWMLALSPNIGWVNTWLVHQFGLPHAPINIYTMAGMIWALSSHSFPLAYLLMGPAFRVLDTRLEEAALAGGARTWEVAARVTLPLLRPAVISTLMLLFVRGIESFEVPRLIGLPAGVHLMTTEIQRSASAAVPHFGRAAALGLLLLVLAVLGVYLYRRATRNAEAYATVTGKGFRPGRVALGRLRWPAVLGAGALFAFALGVPVATLAWQSAYHNGSVSLENYRFVFTYPIVAHAFVNSALLGAGAATIVTLLGFVMAWLAQRALPRTGWLLDALAFAPIAIPGIIIGASVLFAYIGSPIPIYDTLWILLIAYVTMYVPYGMRFAAGGIVQIHRELEDAAAISGAGLLQTFRRVLAPLIAPALCAGWLYVFVLAVRELAASIFLVAPGTQVLGTATLTLWEGGGSYGAVAALGIVQIVPLLAIVIAMRWVERRLGRGPSTSSG